MAIAHVDPHAVTQCQPLPYGPMAVALYASPGLPYPERPRLSSQELAAHAAQGITRLGGVDRVRSLYMEWKAANRALLHDEIGEATYEAKVIALLARMHTAAPDPGRFNRCIAYAYGRERAA